MTKSHWRQTARETIEEVNRTSDHLAAAREGDEAALKAYRKELRAAYPFGPRSRHPYKIWLEEQRAAIASVENWRKWHGPRPEQAGLFDGSGLPLFSVEPQPDTKG